MLEKVQRGGAASSLRAKLKEQGLGLLDQAAELVKLGSYSEAVEMYTTASQCFRDACDTALVAKANAGKEEALRLLSLQSDHAQTETLAKAAYDSGKESMERNSYELAHESFTEAVQLFSFIGNKPWIAKSEAAKKEAHRKMTVGAIRAQCAELIEWMAAYATDETEAWEAIDVEGEPGVRLAQMADPEGGHTTFRARGKVRGGEGARGTREDGDFPSRELGKGGEKVREADRESPHAFPSPFRSPPLPKSSSPTYGKQVGDPNGIPGSPRPRRLRHWIKSWRWRTV
jgi:tetratricopeptide (TPR) repeat protein